MEAVTLKKGSKEPNRIKVGKISLKKVISIAENKMSDFNCFTLKSAISMVAGTARSIGIEILGE
jgi:large subunit ribosomal protein L11